MEGRNGGKKWREEIKGRGGGSGRRRKKAEERERRKRKRKEAEHPRGGRCNGCARANVAEGLEGFHVALSRNLCGSYLTKFQGNQLKAPVKSAQD